MVSASGVAEAMSLPAADVAFDAILVDLRMPEGEDGLALLARLAAAGLAIPALLLSAAADEIEAEARAAGARGILPKPIDLDRLPAILDRRSSPGGLPAGGGPRPGRPR